MIKTRLQSIFKTVFSVTGIIVLLKVIGFFKQILIAATYGADGNTDIINLANGFVGNLQYPIVQMYITAFTTVYISVNEKDKNSGKKLIVDAMKAFLTITLIVVIIVLLVSPIVTGLIAPSYQHEAAKQLRYYICIYAPILLLYVIGAGCRATLNAQKQFVRSELSDVLQNVGFILFIICLYKQMGINALVVGLYGALLINTIYLILLAGKYSERKFLNLSNPYKNENVRRILRMCTPLLLGYSMIYINQMVDKSLVSRLDSGTVTALGYAATLSDLIGTIIVSLVTVLFTYITIHISKENHTGVANIANYTSLVMIVTFLPISIITILCSSDIVKAVFMRGAFSESSAKIAGIALAGYAFSFVPFVLKGVYSQLQYGYQDAKHPMINSSIGIVFNIIVSIILCPRIGVFGVTVASSISCLVTAVLDMITAKKCNQYIKYTYLLKASPFLLAGGTCCFFVTKYCINLFAHCTSLVRFFGCTVFGLLSYAIIVSPLVWKTIKRFKMGE